MDCASSGKIFFNNVEIAKYYIDAYRNSYIGFIFQYFNIISSFSLKENLNLAFDLCNKKPTNKEIRTLLESVGLIDSTTSVTEFLKQN